MVLTVSPSSHRINSECLTTIPQLGLMFMEDNYWEVVWDFLASLRDAAANDMNVSEALLNADSGSH